MRTPFFIVAIVLWFRYKNKQAKYKLAAEALAAGRTIPAELFNDPEEQGNAVMTKGIKNIFLGIGLGVFLWVLTEEEGLAAIGFLIFCMGLGQVLIAYTTTPHKKKKDDPFPPTRINQDENGVRSMKIENIELGRNKEAKETQNIKKQYRHSLQRRIKMSQINDIALVSTSGSLKNTRAFEYFGQKVPIAHQAFFPAPNIGRYRAQR